jgi:uncharacterized protein (TIGR02453 family)
MLQATTVQFLKDLNKNNHKDWFDANRKVYEAARQNFIELTSHVLAATAKFDATIAHLQPKECIFRINRDVRFSKDKSPYKNNMGMSIAPKGKKGVSAGYYFHLQPGESFVGGGLYQPMPDDLKKVRQEIDYNFEAFNHLLKAKPFKSLYKDLDKSAELSLSRPPKGYDDSNEAIDYIKLKSFIAFVPVSDEELLGKQLEKKIVSAFQALQPLTVFLNRALE